MSQAVNKFVETIGRPIIEKIENETGQPIAATVLVIEGGHVAFTAKIPEASLEGARASGEIRLVFKERTNSISFDGQAILQRLAEDTGYSGFLLHGKIKSADGSLRAELTGRTITYNVWDWQPAFRCTTDKSTKQ
ncbi:MAG: hypothetical protein J0M17_22395 [Planctomycetes bacterium]|nr:hypothetical protein [Planctomycetota bacterium]